MRINTTYWNKVQPFTGSYSPAVKKEKPRLLRQVATSELQEMIVTTSSKSMRNRMASIIRKRMRS